LSITLKTHIRNLYLKFLYQLHRPLIKSSENDPFHLNYQEFLKLTRQSDSTSVLQLGSRNVSDTTFDHCDQHIGFDINEGVGVDVVGDAHQLSTLVPQNHFDFAYSISVFEHLLFPWKVALELNKVLKTGGYVFTATHTAWPEHAMPWDFWRFPANGFHAIFNKYTGFEIVTISEGLPARMYSLSKDEPTRPLFLDPMSLGVSLIARKTGDYREDLINWDVDIFDVVDSIYPKDLRKGQS